MKIVTAIGNPEINEKLKKDIFYEVIGVDIQYQEGIFELLEKNKNINYLILNLNLIGELDEINLIEKILEENKTINIIIVLEKENEKLIKYLFSKNIKNIIYKNEININKINNIIKNKKEINLINKQNNKIKNNNFKINNKKTNNIIEKNKLNIFYVLNNFKNKLINKIKLNNKNKLINKKEKSNFKSKKTILNDKKIFINIFNRNKQEINNKKILIIGDRKVGKTIFIILFSKIINKKILIIDFINNSKEINIMFGKKLEEKEQVIKINKNIDLIECNLESLDRKDLKNKLKNYNYIFFDSSNIQEKNHINKIIKNIDKIILIIEPNLIGINNSKIILDNILENKNINKNNINIILNKYNCFSINEKIIKYIFCDYKIIGKINQNNKYNFLINNNFNLIDLKIKKEFLKIIRKVEI